MAIPFFGLVGGRLILPTLGRGPLLGGERKIGSLNHCSLVAFCKHDVEILQQFLHFLAPLGLLTGTLSRNGCGRFFWSNRYFLQVEVCRAVG